MKENLSVTLGQHSIAGLKPQNEDFHGAIVPNGSMLDLKGIGIAVADGVSASEGGKEASQIAVRQFLDDYFSTPDSWTVKHAATKVLGALNLWLFNQGQRQYDGKNGLATTFIAVILKSHTAHLFHVGDSRIYRFREGKLECLTTDHRVKFGKDKEYLARALGIDTRLDIDYRSHNLHLGDCYLLTTDGVHDVLSHEQLQQLLTNTPDNPQDCAEKLVELALQQGSKDNITCQIIRIDTLPQADINELHQQLVKLPFPPDLQAGQMIDGYKILRELNATSRSQVYLAEDTLETHGGQVVIKTPSLNFEDDPLYIDQFMHEEWVAKRLNSPHLIKVCERAKRPRTFLYSVVEYIQGQTLRQWMLDNPAPDINKVRASIDQISRGLRAMHRMEMIHQDLKPDNILINGENTLKIIDFGSTRIAGLAESKTILEHNLIAGTANYSAPEYFKGYPGTNQSDIFSLGVIAYEMLTGQLPFGKVTPEQASKKKFIYISARIKRPDLPDWIDAALEKATHPNPAKRYEAMSEFINDLSQPNTNLTYQSQTKPLLERNPLLFWKGLALVEFIILMVLIFRV